MVFDKGLAAKKMAAQSLLALPGALGGLEPLRGSRVLASGCSGFFGFWIVAAHQSLMDLGLRFELGVWSREPRGLAARFPCWTAAPGIQPMAALREAATAWRPDFAINMLASSDASLNSKNPFDMVAGMLFGLESMMEAARSGGRRLLHVSSGAVYGSNPLGSGASPEHLARSRAPEPLSAALAYGHAKRLCESLLMAGSTGISASVARPFSFLGPALPLGAHFAAGNFLADASAGRPILIKGDGRSVRSYMHPADLAAWLLWLLANAEHGEAVNVGSSEALSIRYLAESIAHEAGSPAPAVLGRQGDADEYWPDLTKASGLGLRPAHGLKESIASSLEWLGRCGGFWGFDGSGGV